MNTAITREAESHLVPEEHALAMIESCAAQIEKAATIPDVMKIIAQAEAIDAVMRKIKAAEKVKDAALRLLIGAEQQLGRVSKQIPQGGRGGAYKPGQNTKKKILQGHGLHPFRCAVAERLAVTPPERVSAAIASAKQKTVSGISTELGLRQPWVEGTRDKTARDLDYLAGEAIDLLELGVKQQKPPPSGNVVEMRDRLNRLRVRK